MRICLYAGAGAGKSTVAAGLYYFLKCKNYNIELVFEFIKKWAYEGKTPKSFDQSYIFGKQLNSEDVFLQCGVKHLVTDSPLMLQVFYAKKYNFGCWSDLNRTAREFEKTYPSLNIFLSREGLQYRQAGRYEDEVTANAVDAELMVFLNEQNIPYKVFPSRDLHGILEYVDPILQA